MIVVAIVAILTAIALPSYKDYIRRGRLPEAFNALADYRTKMEQYYQDNRNYGSAAPACADASTAGSWNTFIPAGAKYFTYSCVSSGTNQQNYLITATGRVMVSASSGADFVYTINQNGDRTTTVFKGNSVTATCWLTSTSTC